MTGNAVRRLEHKYRTVQGAALVSEKLRQEMDARGLTAKELSREVGLRTQYGLDYRTIQHAAGGGSCTLDTYLVLVAFFGWGFNDTITTPIIGATRLASLEREYEQQRARMASLDRDLAVLRAASHARNTVESGRLRLVHPEDGAGAP